MAPSPGPRPLRLLVLGLVLSTSALVACAPVGSSANGANPTATPLRTDEDSSSATQHPDDESVGCGVLAFITTPSHELGSDAPVELRGELVDRGASASASGPVGYNADQQIESYTVAQGDSLMGIGERFCVDFVTVAVYNHRFSPNPTIQPGDVLTMRPDPTAPWSPDAAS
jgi:hypothetical protein